MSGQVMTVSPVPWAGTVLRRVPGTRLLGRYEGGGYVDDRYLVMRPDGQPVLLTHLPYLVVRHADGGNDALRVAEMVSQDYGRRLSLELLARLIEERLVPAGLMPALRARPGAAATRPAAGQSTTSGAAANGSDQAVEATSERAAAPARSEPLLSVTLSQAFLPARVVRRLAGWACPAFHPLAITLVLMAFTAGNLWLFLGLGGGGGSATLTDPGDLLAVLALLGLSTLLHEVGHAAGCRYGGGRPGAIGAGLYLWFPVFWTDVTDAYRLDRVGRLRTDLGGVYFNALFVALASAGYALTGWSPLAVAVVLTNIVALQQLLPVVRMDGYYILGDLTGVPNLFGLLGPTLRSMIPGREPDPRVRALRPGVRRVVVAWAVVSTLVLGGSLVALVVGAPALAGSTWSQMRAFWAVASRPEDLATTVYAWICLVLLVVPFVGFAALLARSARLSARRARGRPKGEGAMTTSLELDHDRDQEPDPRRGPVNAVPPLPRLTAADFTEEFMLRARRRPPSGGWRRQVFLATGGLVHPGPSAAERRESELVERVRTRLTSARRIVVLSRKGGAGKTTTTLMLGHTLAIHRGDRVVALDANPDAGSLPYRVERESSATVTSLLADADRLTSYAQVRAHTSQAPSRLEIVASDDDPRITHALGQADYSRAIDLLDQHYMLLLMDTGTGILDEATQGLLREADQVVVVMPPALDGARVAASTLDWLDEHGYTSLVRGAVAVINGVRGESGLVHLDAIEAHFRARCAGVVQIPWDRALEAGARTAPEDLRSATRTAYLELAALVAEGFGADPGRVR
jgi:putative peptide zinc metalloprotease protein